MDDALVVLGNSVVVPPQVSLNQSFLLGQFSALGNPLKRNNLSQILSCYTKFKKKIKKSLVFIHFPIVWTIF
jgi:hypothetical protein